MQSQIPEPWYLFSTYHMQYLYLVPCCTCRCNVIYFCMNDLDPTKCTTMFPFTSCHNPLSPMPHKVFRNHAAYSRHLNCSTRCLHYYEPGLPQEIVNIIFHHHMWWQQAPDHLRYCIHNLLTATPHFGLNQSDQVQLLTEFILPKLKWQEQMMTFKVL